MIFIVLPAYNEEKNVAAVIADIVGVLNARGERFKIIVVDDGSADNTAGAARGCADAAILDIIRFECNQGIGAVFRAGISRVLRDAADDDIMISMDCDRSHRAQTMEKLLDALASGADMSVASRYHPESRTSGLPLTRAILSDTINAVLRGLFPLSGLRDYTTFYRAYVVNILRQASRHYDDTLITQPGFSAIAQIAIRLRRLSPRVCEVPVMLRFDLRTGKSKMKKLRTVVEYLRLICSEGMGWIQRRRSQNSQNPTSPASHKI